jgi:drug/metabolite transporter (DMT)-like permease
VSATSGLRGRDAASLVLLAALWGASFLFMRVAVPEFGAIPAMALRAGIGAVILAPLLLAVSRRDEFTAKLGHIAIVSFFGTALPFVLFGYAMAELSAGFGAVLNSTAPFWTALVALVWFRERLGWWRSLGLAIGFAGVLVLVWSRFSFAAGGDALPILSACAATLSYGATANYTRHHLGGVSALTNASGSLVLAGLMLAPLAWLTWPATTPGIAAWLAILMLGLLCTALAYIIYFRLLARVGPSRAMAVTFLIPMFGMLWGVLFLGESLSANMIYGAAIILGGTALTTGAWPRRGAGGR